MTAMIRSGVTAALIALMLGGAGVLGLRGDLAQAKAKDQAGATRAEKKKDKKPPRGKPDREEKQAKRTPMDDAREQAALDPAQPYWPWRLGELYQAADSSAQAEAAFKASLARDPDYAPALARLSKIYYDARRHADAVELLEGARDRAASRSRSLSTDLLAGLALHYDALDRAERARATLASVAPGEAARARGALVYVLLRGASPDSAAGPAAAAVDDDPRSAVHQNNYGITRLRAGDPVAARRAFLKAIEVNPRLPGPYYNLAILEKYYRFDEVAAARWFDAYRQRGHDDPDSLLHAFARRDAGEPAGKGR